MAGFKFPQALNLVIGLSNNNGYLRNCLSVIQTLTLEFKIPLAS